MNAEIEKAKNTLQAAGVVFQRHATKFDNQDDVDETMSFAQKLDKKRKITNIDLTPNKPKSKPFLMKLINVPVTEHPQIIETAQTGRRRKINSLIDTGEIADPLETLAMQPIKRKFLKRKKSVSF